MQDTPDPSSLPKRPPIRVAIVEDDPRIQRSLVSILQEDDLECVGVFSSAEEALAQLPRLKPRVVLMDVNLPGMDGVECVRRISAQLAETQIIMLTVREDANIIFESLAAGACGYLLKPPDADELIAAVRDVFAGGAPMTPAIARQVVKSFKQSAPASNELERLSPREMEVLKLLAEGLTYKEVAGLLEVGYSSVHRYVERIYRKLHVHSRGHAVAKYFQS